MIRNEVVICEIGYEVVIREKDRFTVTIIIYSNLKIKTNTRKGTRKRPTITTCYYMVIRSE